MQTEKERREASSVPQTRVWPTDSRSKRTHSITLAVVRELVTELSLGVTAELTIRVSTASSTILKKALDEVHGGLGGGAAGGVLAAARTQVNVGGQGTPFLLVSTILPD